MSNQDLTEERQYGQSRRKFIQSGCALAAATFAHHVASGPSFASAETLPPEFQASGRRDTRRAVSKGARRPGTRDGSGRIRHTIGPVDRASRL